jgi:hypothetical protein
MCVGMFTPITKRLPIVATPTICDEPAQERRQLLLALILSLLPLLPSSLLLLP